MSSVPKIRASVLIPIVKQIEAAGFDPDILLTRHGLLASRITDPYANVPLARYISIFEQAAEMSGIPHLGAQMGTMVTPGDLGPTGVLFSISPTILDAIKRLTHHVAAIQGGTSCGLRAEDGDIVWSYKLTSATLWPRRQDSEFTLSACCQLIRSGFSRNWRPAAVHFEHQAPADVTTLKSIFKAPLKFGQTTNRLVISEADANRLYRSEDPGLLAVLEHHIADLAQGETAPQSLTDAVKSLIETKLGYSKITVGTISEDLGLTPRTFQRRLQEDGTSLREIVAEYRREVADKQLREKLPKAEIADMLGYANSTVLWRARRRWRR